MTTPVPQPEGGKRVRYQHKWVYRALRQAFLSLEKEALRMRLKIKEKYMPCTKSCLNNSHFKIEAYNFEVVNRFT
ncbi:hypothetical protein TNCV_3804211 [Trichonephila clavipes]|nr:hypothetical protein TNCV_3804211 [Trichonephila clavipes]